MLVAKTANATLLWSCLHSFYLFAKHFIGTSLKYLEVLFEGVE